MFINRRGQVVGYTTPSTSKKYNNVGWGVTILLISLMVNYIATYDWYQHLMVALSNM